MESRIAGNSYAESAGAGLSDPVGIAVAFE